MARSRLGKEVSVELEYFSNSGCCWTNSLNDPLTHAMTTAFKESVQQQPEFEKESGTFTTRSFLRRPYLFRYQSRSPTALDGLGPKSCDFMKLLTAWIEDNYGNLYERAEEQKARGVVSPETMQFLIRPGDVVLSKEKLGRVRR